MSYIFDDSYRRSKRKELVKFFYEKIANTGISHHILAFVVKAIHFTFSYFTFLIYLFAPIGFSIFTLVIALCFWFMFIYLKGCFLSNVEYKLNSNDFINIIDPYLSALEYPINDETRYMWTWYLAMLYFSFAFVAIYIRLKMRNFTKS